MLRKKLFFLLPMMVLFTISAQAQNSMGVGTTTPNPNAVLDLVSPTSNQGLLVPRLTTAQRTDAAFTGNLTAADNGLMVFDSDEGQFYFWFSGSWQAVRDLNAGDMSTITYDTDLDGKVDSTQYATIAGAIDGFTIESSVPAGAVFTDSQTAADVAVTPESGVTSTDVQSALVELQSEIVSGGGGDMATAIYDINTDDIVDRAESSDSLSTDFIDGVSLAYNAAGFIEISDNGISTTKIADGAVTNVKISTISVTKLDPTEGSDGQSVIYTGGSWLPGFQDAVNINYDNASSGLTGIFDVQAAIDELANQISTPPALSLQDAYDNGNLITTSAGNPFSIAGIFTASNLDDATDTYAISGIVPTGQTAGSAAYFQTADGAINDPTVVIENAGTQRGLFVTTTNGFTGLPALQADYGGQGAAMILNSTNASQGVLIEFQEQNVGVASVGDDGSFNGTSLGLTNGSLLSMVPDPQTGAASLFIPDLGGTDNTIALASDLAWTFTGSDIYYTGGNVGIGVTTPLSPLQVNNLNYFTYSNAPIDGDFLANNLYSDGTTVRYLNAGTAAAIYFATSGEVDFLVGSNQAADTDATAGGIVETALQLTVDRDVNLSGGIEVGTANTPTPNDGMLSFDAGRLQVYEGGQFVNVTGLDLPFESTVNETAQTVFSVTNGGTSEVARFVMNNTVGGPALTVRSASTDPAGRGIEVTHLGDAIAGQFRLTGGLSGANTPAVFAITDGLGSAGRFEVNNASSTSPALSARVDQGTGPAIEGFTNGSGPIASFRNNNPANNSVGISVENSGDNSAASFTTNSSAAPAVEITQNGAGPAFSVQSPGGTSTVGDVTSFLAGNVGIGTNTPGSTLDVQGTASVSGNVVSGGTITAADYQYDAAVTQTKSYSALVFERLQFGNDTSEFVSFNATTTYKYFNGTVGNLGYAVAHVDLPTGAVVTEVRGWLYDNNATLPTRIELIRTDHGSGTDIGMASVETTVDDIVVQELFDNTIFSSTIDNSAASYFLRFTGVNDNQNETRLYNATITYTVQKPN